jgi:hypothetical protein
MIQTLVSKVLGQEVTMPTVNIAIIIIHNTQVRPVVSVCFEIRRGGSERLERPGSDADAAEIAEWMKEDFGRAVAEEVANAVDEADHDDEHEVIEVEILNQERSEVLET